MRYPQGTTTGTWRPIKKHKHKANRYNAKKIRCDGYTFDSKSEYHYYLKLMENHEHFTIHEPFEIVPKFQLDDPHKVYRHRVYTPDFVIYDKHDNIKKVVDVKGMPGVKDGASLRMDIFSWHYKIPITIARYDYGKGIFYEHIKK